MDETISRNEAIKATLALCPQNIKQGSLDEYGATILCGVVDVILRQLPAIDAIPVEWLRRQYHKYMQNNDKLMCDAYAVVMGEWHDWQKEQEGR